jgi:hypothetical protein
MGLLLCLTAFAASLVLARRSHVAGVGAVLTTGYLYGIVRANYLDTFAHFIFDAAVVGYYLAVLPDLLRPAADPSRQLRSWVLVLMGWAGFMFLLPLQHLLIQLVGLRGNAFLVPFLLVGARLRPADLGRLVLWIAALNGVTLAFAAGEYFLGVPQFYPLNSVTAIIYKSNDVAGYTAYRIPATFATPHSYAGTMVATVPWLVGGLVQPGLRAWQRLLLLVGAGAALLGVFLTATRVGFVLLLPLLLVATLSGRLRGGRLIAWVLLLGAVAYAVSNEERMQRFLTLQDSEAVLSRVEGSVNMAFFDLLVRYPLGNGLGAGGTSIPFFLQHLINDPVGMENEYSRLLLEQGVVGLGLWLAFAAWVLLRPNPPRRDPWRLGWRMLWWATAGSFALALLGIGLMTSIPQTVLFFLGAGFLAVPRTGPSGPPPVARPQTRETRILVPATNGTLSLSH